MFPKRPLSGNLEKSRLEARNDEELDREVQTHAPEEHDEMNLIEERAREMVASHASGT